MAWERRLAALDNLTAASLGDILAELRRIRQLLEVQAEAPRAPVCSLSRADRSLLAHLLPAVAGSLGSELFCTAELFESNHAAVRIGTAGIESTTGRPLAATGGRDTH